MLELAGLVMDNCFAKPVGADFRVEFIGTL